MGLNYSSRVSVYKEKTDGVIAHFHADGNPVLRRIKGTASSSPGSIANLIISKEVTLS